MSLAVALIILAIWALSVVSFFTKIVQAASIQRLVVLTIAFIFMARVTNSVVAYHVGLATLITNFAAVLMVANANVF